MPPITQQLAWHFVFPDGKESESTTHICTGNLCRQKDSIERCTVIHLYHPRQLKPETSMYTQATKVTDITLYSEQKGDVERFLEIVRRSSFSNLYGGGLNDPKSPTITINPTIESGTLMLLKVSLIRLCWEYPNVVREIVEAHEKGHTPDESICMGHILGAGGCSGGHTIWAGVQSLWGYFVNHKMEDYIRECQKLSSMIHDVRSDGFVHLSLNNTMRTKYQDKLVPEDRAPWGGTYPIKPQSLKAAHKYLYAEWEPTEEEKKEY